MSRELLSILLSELKVIRVRCKTCKSEAIIECPVEKIERTFEYGKCPICKQDLRTPTTDGRSYLVIFAKALEQLADDSAFEFEFILPVQADKK